jgi:hypothetical protein
MQMGTYSIGEFNVGTFVGWTISPSTVCDAISVEDGAMGSTGRTPDEDLLDLAEEDVVLLDFPELLVFSDLYKS